MLVAFVVLPACGGDDGGVRAAEVNAPTTSTSAPDAGVGASLTTNVATTQTAAPATTTPPTLAPTEPPEPSVPGDVLDLDNWKLTLPVPGPGGEAAEITQPDLTGFSDPNFRLAGRSVVFTAPADGATTPGSKYPRCELREMASGGSTEAAWSSTSGSHVMEITQLISKLPQRKPELVAGQIHDAEDDVVMIRLEDEDLIVEGGGEHLADLDTNYVLGSTFTVRIEAAEGRIKVFYNGVQKLDHPFVGDGLYFKAGVYTQSNADQEEPPGAAGQVVITALHVEHR